MAAAVVSDIALRQSLQGVRLRRFAPVNLLSVAQFFV
jgi:hypothetical protein